MIKSDRIAEVALADIGRVITGRTPPSDKAGYLGGSCPFITPSDMIGQKYIRVTERYLSADGRALLHRCVVPAGSVTVSCIGWQMGKAAMVDRDSVTNQQLNTIIPNSSVDPHFLYYQLSTRREELKRLGSVGTRTPIVNKSVFSGLKIRLPALPEQRRIAGILSPYDDLIENCERRIRVLEEAARALFREWFANFRYPGYERVPLVESPLGKIPRAWKITSLRDGAATVEDGDWIETKDQGTCGFRLVQISNVGLGNFVETGNYRYVTDATFERLRCAEVLPGDILVARMPSPIGRAWLVTQQPFRMVTAVDVAIIRTDPTRLLPSYLARAWNDDWNLRRIAAQASGTTRPRVTRRELAALPFVIPPLGLQQQFHSRVHACSKLTEVLRRQAENLRQTRDLLLPRLMSGQLSVGLSP